jgi:hypothetical protein
MSMRMAAYISPCLCTFLSAGPLDDPQNCQPFDDSVYYAISDPTLGTSGIVALDDFIAGAETLAQVRVWGFYFDAAGGAGDCAAFVEQDHFRVRVFENDPVSGRRPEVLFADALAASNRIAILGSQLEFAVGSVVYQFDLTLSTPIAGLVPGRAYWLEVSNVASLDGPPGCTWFWVRRQPVESSFSWYASPIANCGDYRAAAYDQAFCADFELSPSAIGGLHGPCCTCDGVCQETTLKICQDLSGDWDVLRSDCAEVSCVTVPNDHCVDGPMIVTEGQYDIPRVCVTTDGYGPIPTDVGSAQLDGDVWYKFIAPSGCDLEIHTCLTNAPCFDTVLAVYHDPENPTTCPPCPLLSDPNGAAVSQSTLAGLGSDENCFSSVPSNGRWLDIEQIGRQALPGECFLIRVGNFPGANREVEGQLVVDCINLPRPLSPDPSGINSSRFISFEAPQETGLEAQTAIRVQLIALHHTWYFPQVIHPFYLFEGRHVWVGPPDAYSESSATAEIFQGSTVQCTPHYRDWSTVGLLHVTGVSIVPGSTYRVERVAITCQGREDDPDCQPGGSHVSSQLEIKTTRWGDVASPFNPPSLSVQPDLADVSSLVDKFRNIPGAPIKAQSLLVGVDAFGTVDMAANFGFQHIAACADAFRGQRYVHKMGRCATGGGSCTSDSDCSGSGSAPPCELYCP